jgi:hypothetical protein
MLKSERRGCLEASAAKMRWTRTLLAWLVSAFAGASGVAATPSETARDWLIKQVCVDAADAALSVDPYPACPAGTSARKLRFGEALPYHNIDQPGVQQNDALPGRDRAGREIYFHTFDYAPFGVFNLYDGSDGFDTYVVRDGWVSSPDTRDGGGFGTVFFGGRCSLGSGWVYFPEKGFLSGGEVHQPIAVRYWEQSSENFPGSCPAGYSTDTLTTWKFTPAFPFGGLGGVLGKPMDAMVSHHGFRDDEAFLANGHMEVFYFTEQYGLTRWEVWTPIAQGGAPSSDCAGTGPFDYRGVRFIVRYCHDWSKVVPAVPPQPVVWPLPLSNLLAHFHFGEGFEKDWRATAAADGSPAWSIQNSTLPADRLQAPNGVRTLRIQSAIHQDIPAASFVSGARYAYGISGRARAGTAKVRLSLVQIDTAGGMVGESAARFVLPERAGQYANPRPSVVLASETVLARTRLEIDRRTVTVRFTIEPLSPGGLELLDSWVIRLDDPLTADVPSPARD